MAVAGRLRGAQSKARKKSGSVSGLHADVALTSQLEAIQCGVVLVNAQGKVHHCNKAALQLLGLAPDPATGPHDIAKLLPKLESLRVLEHETKSVLEMEVAEGKSVNIHVARTSSGLTLTIKDHDDASSISNAKFMVEEEYRSLFENANCGIYRDRVDGTPIRSNPALVKFNGYETEAEYRKAVAGEHSTWYVDPTRSAAFHQMMKTEGCVRDFVSEVYRHRTREAVWITENAWYVRNKLGEPIYIEGTIQDASERIATMAIIEQQANLDSLTGLASRHKFLHALEALIKEGDCNFTVYSIDLDRFKPINDIYGHAMGDLVLRTVGAKLRALVPATDLVARLGGDEFAILQHNVSGPEDVSAIASKIVAEMRRPLWLKGYNLIVGSSIGIASFPAQGADAAALLGNADLALYKAKKSGGNSFCIFDTELRSALQRRMNVEEELKSAIAKDELELFYQPVVVAANGAIQGYEALMRWHHPIRGLLPPSEFIQIAEDTGLMADLGNWAIACACRQAAALPADIKVAVNVSASQFRSSSILDVLRRSLAETKLDPSRLVIEITESVILANEAIADMIHHELRGMGVLIALDDFGTGYSSLSYLQRFRFDKVKIDRSFVNGMADSPANLAIVRAIIGIGTDLGINIVAEGVETEAQAKMLIEGGCPLLQGYFYGKPKPFADAVNDLAVQRLGREARGATEKAKKLA